MWQLLVAQTTFIIQAIMFLLLFGAYWLAVEKRFIDHRKLMRYMFWTQMILNVIMVISLLTIPADVAFIPHILVATPLNVLIIYTYLTMERKLPKKLMIRREMRPLLMRVTSVAWGIAIISGLFSFMYFGM